MPFLRPPDLFVASVASAKKKESLSWHKTLVSAFMSGVYVGLGGLCSTRMAAAIPVQVINGVTYDALRRFALAAFFPVGLVIIIMNGTELLTGNMMFCGLALLTVNRKKESVWRVFLAWCKNWFWTFIGNLSGCLFTAYILGYLPGLFAAEPYTSFAKALAENKAGNQLFYQNFLRAIGCNTLVCLAILMCLASDDFISKIFASWFVITTFVCIGFEHFVANLFFIPLGLMCGAAVPVGAAVASNLVPVFLGNLLGAWFLVALSSWYLLSAGASPKPPLLDSTTKETGTLGESLSTPANPTPSTAEPSSTAPQEPLRTDTILSLLGQEVGARLPTPVPVVSTTPCPAMAGAGTPVGMATPVPVVAATPAFAGGTETEPTPGAGVAASASGTPTPAMRRSPHSGTRRMLVSTPSLGRGR